MFLKVNRAVYDRYNPEQMICEGQYVKVEDKDRIDFMISEGLAEPCEKEPKEFFVFGEKAETTDKSPAPKKAVPKRAPAKKG